MEIAVSISELGLEHSPNWKVLKSNGTSTGWAKTGITRGVAPPTVTCRYGKPPTLQYLKKQIAQTISL